MTWKKITVQRAVRSGPPDIPGYAHAKAAGLAFHRPHADSKIWTVTHMPSGLGTGFTANNIQCARALTLQMAQRINWNVSQSDVLEAFKSDNQYLVALRQAFQFGDDPAEMIARVDKTLAQQATARPVLTFKTEYVRS